MGEGEGEALHGGRRPPGRGEVGGGRGPSRPPLERVHRRWDVLKQRDGGEKNGTHNGGRGGMS